MGHNPSPPPGSPATGSPLIAVFARLMNRLPASTDRVEFEQALIRLVFACVVVAYVAVEAGPFAAQAGGWTDTVQVLAIGAGGFCLIAAGIVAAIVLWPATSVTRRIVGMLADVGFATLYVWLAGENGAFMVAVYLFLTFGYGFRYGLPYLHGCQGLSIVGLGAAGLFVPYWQQHSTEIAAFLFTLLMIPFYVAVVLARIKQALARSGAALKECLERRPA